MFEGDYRDAMGGRTPRHAPHARSSEPRHAVALFETDYSSPGPFVLPVQMEFRDVPVCSLEPSASGVSPEMARSSHTAARWPLAVSRAGRLAAIVLAETTGSEVDS